MKEKNPLVSVIVPIYNTERFLLRCVGSILEQDYGNLQIILVDDASTDNSLAMAQSIAVDQPKVSVFMHKTNKGLSVARNTGLLQADGEYIVFVDSDDCIHKTYISRMLTVAHASDSDIVQCKIQEFSDEIQINTKPKLNEYTLYKSKEALKQIYNPLLATEMIIAPNKLYKTTLFSDIQFPAGRFHEDEATTYRLIFKAKRIALIPDHLYFYFYNVEGITKGMSLDAGNRAFDALLAFRERYYFFRYNNLTELLQPTKSRIISYYLHIARSVHVATNDDRDLSGFIEKVQANFSHDTEHVLLNGSISIYWRILVFFAKRDFRRLLIHERLKHYYSRLHISDKK